MKNVQRVSQFGTEIRSLIPEAVANPTKAEAQGGLCLVEAIASGAFRGTGFIKLRAIVRHSVVRGSVPSHQGAPRYTDNNPVAWEDRFMFLQATEWLGKRNGTNFDGLAQDSAKSAQVRLKLLADALDADAAGAASNSDAALVARFVELLAQVEELQGSYFKATIARGLQEPIGGIDLCPATYGTTPPNSDHLRSQDAQIGVLKQQAANARSELVAALPPVIRLCRQYQIAPTPVTALQQLMVPPDKDRPTDGEAFGRGRALAFELNALLDAEPMAAGPRSTVPPIAPNLVPDFQGALSDYIGCLARILKAQDAFGHAAQRKASGLSSEIDKEQELLKGLTEGRTNAPYLWQRVHMLAEELAPIVENARLSEMDATDLLLLQKHYAADALAGPEGYGALRHYYPQLVTLQEKLTVQLRRLMFSLAGATGKKLESVSLHGKLQFKTDVEPPTEFSPNPVTHWTTDAHMPDAKGEVMSPSDLSAYVSATNILNNHDSSKRVRTHKKLVGILNSHPEIKRHRPRANRLMVHLADWLTFASGKAKTTSSKNWASQIEVEKNKQLIKREKYGGE